MAKPVIVSATRTPIGTLGGALAQKPATKLGAIAVREAIQRAKLDPAQVDEVILGTRAAGGARAEPRARRGARGRAAEGEVPVLRRQQGVRLGSEGGRAGGAGRSCSATPTSSSPAAWRA